MGAGRSGVDRRRRGGRRRGAAGSVTSPPPDHSGASPPVGRPQSPHALVPGQPSASRRWHPGCRRCLLKGCERWFLPRRPQARYCSPACQAAARRWRRWLAAQRYRATGNGRQRPTRPGPTLSRPGPPALLPPSARSPHAPGRAAAAGRRSPASPRHRSDTAASPTPAWASAQAKSPKRSTARPAIRPGCYVLFLPAPRSPDRRFCSASCRRALRRVRQREARLRRRRRRGIPPRRRPHRGPPRPISLMSSRIEQAGH